MRNLKPTNQIRPEIPNEPSGVVTEAVVRSRIIG